MRVWQCKSDSSMLCIERCALVLLGLLSLTGDVGIGGGGGREQCCDFSRLSSPQGTGGGGGSERVRLMERGREC